MEFYVFGYKVTITKKGWKQEVIDTVNKEIKVGRIESRFIPIIKLVRQLGYLFPEEYEHSSDHQLIGLREAKEFVEENWPQLSHRPRL